MRVVDIIARKRDGLRLTEQEINLLITGFSNDDIPDYQMASWLMAVFFRGLTDEETATLTIAMVNSGKKVDLSSVSGIKVDKHSTGGVADTTTLVLAPLVAAAGVPVAKMSGRGLGFTGGTIDKLESIPGFRTMLTTDEFLANLQNIKLAVTGQTPDIVPADGRIYALRDVTATVESIPLIASSIMSKKIAAGADKIVLDVKTGSGAFMKTVDDAVALASLMVRIGSLVGRQTMAVISSMEEPLGRAVGNSLEVEEAMDILSGKITDGDLYQVCLTIGGHMLVTAGAVESFSAGFDRLRQLLRDGKGLAKFAEMIKAQGGNPAVIENRNLLPRSAFVQPVYSREKGYVTKIDTASIGYTAMILGAGREYKGQDIDLGAGLVMRCRIGDYIEAGQEIATLYTNKENKLPEAAQIALQAIAISDGKPPRPPLIFGTVDAGGVHLQ